ncbi:Gfo/Idh/MocA family protein [Hippea sp. KM1]|uniref:Gfo/Idh/MocA family protein n=1 Tax=Hippea sp. KM1 TaxID=944481 RepID=UPI00046CF8D7|nr:Gfo/Idh/MocA family oxidoreductase [Hippea sp. KM1]
MKYKVGFVGGGINSVVGRVHKIAIEMDDRFEVVAGVFSRFKESNKKSAEIYNVRKFYPTIKDMIRNERLDVVCILTPTNRHVYDIEECLNLNEEIVIVSEKTIATSLSEIKTLKGYIKRNLFVTYNYTGYPMLRELREWVLNDKIGKVLNINLFMPQEGFLKKANNKKLAPQDWRRKDYEIPTIYLDLGIHLYSILSFILNSDVKIKSVKSLNKSFSQWGVIDSVSSILLLKDDIVVNIWFSKVALGHTNGLEVEVYGEKGSLRWHQLEPEYLYYCDDSGNKLKLDRGSDFVIEARKERYNRFKVGHPDGYIEAFANYYYDIAEILKNRESFSSVFVFDFADCEKGMEFLTMIKEGEICC